MRCTIYLPEIKIDGIYTDELGAIVALLKWQMWSIKYDTTKTMRELMTIHQGKANPSCVFVIEVPSFNGDKLILKNYNELLNYMNSRGLWLC